MEVGKYPPDLFIKIMRRLIFTPSLPPPFSSTILAVEERTQVASQSIYLLNLGVNEKIPTNLLAMDTTVIYVYMSGKLISIFNPWNPVPFSRKDMPLSAFHMTYCKTSITCYIGFWWFLMPNVNKEKRKKRKKNTT